MALFLLTGGPGQGKTALVASLVADLVAAADDPGRIAVLAPTGIAAAALADHLPPSLTPVTVDRFLLSPQPRASLRALIVDEFWCCPGETFRDLLGTALLDPLALVVLAGDPRQLPPFDGAGHALHLSLLAKAADALHTTPRIIVLDAPLPPRFASVVTPGLLPADYAAAVYALWRGAPMAPDAASALADLWAQTPWPDALVLAARRDVVRSINATRARAVGCSAAFSPESVPDRADAVAPGTPVLLTRNLDPESGWANGTLAVLAHAPSADVAVLRRADGSTRAVRRMPRFDDPARLELPFALGFAATVHRAQGWTLRVPYTVDASVFRTQYGPGTLAMVALSRAADPALVRVAGLTRDELYAFLLGDWGARPVALLFNPAQIYLDEPARRRPIDALRTRCRIVSDAPREDGVRVLDASHAGRARAFR